jgi:hypothetical protein
MMKAARAAEAYKQLNPSPPLACGLSSRSPTMASSGRVRTNAAQNSRVRRYLPAVVRGRDDRETSCEHDGTSLVAESRFVGHPVPEGDFEGLT